MLRLVILRSRDRLFAVAPFSLQIGKMLQNKKDIRSAVAAKPSRRQAPMSKESPQTVLSAH
ncbi:MAG: hypothetical protein DMF36_06130 [Verrucomicrobia bacterium]|jgi:hypothetical protein|nr:MAG: hypothetical protein AUH08_04120 [Verrucomicrobia bacterium 13_2_20CM_54_12]OLB44606.1 MAG: hypothetical protein AUI00_01265 [Verrucomicrobia bacterium 13_2_20CM_2_54_15]OLD73466.1 MAG: hypothetical protein AUF68_03495 [Verrucomicrobia bacterium 13_1_20CM_54_28]OLD87849.1 MAG: hypothetical protein AUG81_07980 [Verrucomicrobia bacterium 13_1_20CM_4_54_11]OLE12599.1 MAG: hypothetical protein AUG52_03315 [Verrucomicrobia bacterium 13_1_20CM_3_54_17]PYK16133.1 MAG: hypothetical protein DME